MLWGSASGSDAGSKDFVHIKGYHFWPFGMATTTNLYPGVFKDGNTVAASFGEIDGLDAQGFDSFYGQLNFTSDSQYGAYSFNHVGLDSDHANLNVAGAGYLQISNFFSSKDNLPTDTAITISSGQTFISNFHLMTSAAVPSIVVSGGLLAIDGGLINSNATSVSAATQSGGVLKINNVSMQAASSAYTAPYVAQTGGTLVANNDSFGGGSSGVGFSVGSDNVANNISNIGWGGWTLSLPSTVLKTGGTGNYGPVAKPGADVTSVQLGAYTVLGLTSTGYYDTALGYAALGGLTSGKYNTALGSQAGEGITSGQYNTFVGENAGLAVAATSFNTVVGASSMQTNAGGGQNTVIGATAGTKIAGANNTVIGYSVGSTTLAGGSSNILIGTSSSIDTPSGISTNYLNIGGLLIGDVSKGHTGFGGTALTSAKLSSCGTSPAIATNSTDHVGYITAGSGATGCTLTFANAWSSAPACTVSSRSGLALTYTPGTSTLVVSNASLGGTVFDYHCDALGTAAP
jgi:hypothetical protein